MFLALSIYRRDVGEERTERQDSGNWFDTYSGLARRKTMDETTTYIARGAMIRSSKTDGQAEPLEESFLQKRVRAGFRTSSHCTNNEDFFYQ